MTNEELMQMETMPVGIVAMDDDASTTALEDLERRITDLEAALREVQSMKASGAAGRKTVATVAAKGSEHTDVDGALRGLSVEQRIAVKSGLIRAGVL